MPSRNIPLRDDEMETIDEIIMNQRMQNLGTENNNINKHIGKTPLPPELLRK
jgi:hypothetical protein